MLLLACAAALMASPALGKLPRTYQVTTVDSPDPHPNDRFGDTMVNAGGDINGDGPDDFIVGIGRDAKLKGRIFVISGADGSVIREIPGPLDDVNNNTIEDEGTPGDPDAPTGFGSAIAAIADIGRCTDPVTFEPGGDPGQDCNTGIVSLADQNTGDGVPDILVGAPGLDITTESDDRGAVFVIDGDTGAILKRIHAPDSDGIYDFGFGREVLSPGGETACAGTGRGGISKCQYGGSPAVQNGDINDQGKADIIVGAPDYNDTAATNPACTDGAGGGTCSRSGRTYVFYGESLAGLSSSQYASTASLTIKNPFAQDDNSSVESRYWGEEMGLSLAPVGDIGSCNQAGTPGSECPENMRNSLTPDGQPEYTISVPRADVGGIRDAGLVFVMDGATGTRLETYSSSEPQTEALFGFSNSNRPAIGEVGGINKLPDIYIPAIGQTVNLTGEGRGYVYSGSPLGTQLISTLTDPTPAKFGNFGTSSVGIGDVAGAEVGLNPRNEIMVGSYGEVAGSLSDVQILSPETDRTLQTIADPDQQPASGFGRGLVPLGDTNADGMLDFAVGAPGFRTLTQSNRGRVYIFVSDDSPLPPAPKPPSTPQQPTTTPTTQVLAGRSIEIEASRSRITAGRQVRLRGVIDAFTNEVRCERNQTVQIQRRRRGSVLYRTFTEVKSNGSGTFSLKLKPQRTYFYRARLSQSTHCIGVVSPREQVTVRKKPKASSHEQRSRAGKIGQ